MNVSIVKVQLIKHSSAITMRCSYIVYIKARAGLPKPSVKVIVKDI